MADKKISGLPDASVPLAGTEVLPIVQSSTTVKVSSDNLTVKNIRSNATSGILQVAGPATAATRVMTVPDANFSAARIDAAQSFTGDQTLSTGNLIVGTSGKGIDFSATANPGGMSSELFADYEEGTWTPTIAGVTTPGTQTYIWQRGTYTKVGNRVFGEFAIIINVKDATTAGLLIVDGLPFVANSNTGIPIGAISLVSNCTFSAGYTYVSGSIENGASRINLTQHGSAALNNLQATSFTNGTQFIGSFNYFV